MGANGYDKGKNVKGRKRHLVVDTLGTLRRLTAEGTPTWAEGFVAGAPDGAVYFDAMSGFVHRAGYSLGARVCQLVAPW